MQCTCGRTLELQEIEELDGSACFIRFDCGVCDFRLGVEVEPKQASPLVDYIVWTDEAQHLLDRMPPYVEPLVREEVEHYARQKEVTVVASAFLAEARNRGAVSWNSEAESRLARVPAGVRALARMELERTALDRGMAEVTVSLMEEVKARYFGMRADYG
ncbi:MAG: PCP reductase family protein [Nitrospinae bacterium]|nr:PCP reductase family protein [Nitrospinota bacterium]